MLTLGRDMFHIAGKTNFVISVRLAGALTVVCAMAFGGYLALYGSLATGLVWIMSALTLGWVGNMVFSLLLVLISDARNSAARHTTKVIETPHNRYRRLHLGSGTNKAP